MANYPAPHAVTDEHEDLIMWVVYAHVEPYPSNHQAGSRPADPYPPETTPWGR